MLSLDAHNCHASLFADDQTIFKNFSKFDSDFDSVQRHLDSISYICKKMQIKISANKFRVLTLYFLFIQ